MIISPYQQGIVDFNFKPFEVNLDLAAKVLGHKQQEFDANYSHLQNLKQEALNINFLNQKEQGKVNEYNKRINEYFSNQKGEFGDLSSNGIITGHMDIFRKLGSDTNLINRYRKDKQLQTELQGVIAKSRSKDPAKNGYHPMNHEVYERRVAEYANTDLDEYATLHPNAPVPTVKGYDNYIDLDKLSKEAALDVPEEEFTREERDGKGTIVKNTYKKRDPGKVKKAISRVLNGQGATQLKVEAEYTHYNNKNNPEYKQQLWEESQDQLLGQKQQLQAYKKQLTPEQSVEIDNVNKKLQVIDKKLAEPNEFDTKTDEELISYLVSVHSEGTLNSMTQAYSYSTVSQELEKDDVFWEGMKLERLIKKDRADIALRGKGLQIQAAKLGIEQQKLALEKAKLTLEGTGSTQASVVPETMVDVASELANHTFAKVQEFSLHKKSFLELGISSEDLGIDRQITVNRISEIESKMSGMLGGKAGSSKEQLAEYSRLRKEKLKLEQVLITPEISNKYEWIANIRNNENHYDKYPVGNAPEIIAAKEAITNLKRRGITPTNLNVEEEIDNVLKDSTSRAYQREMRLKQEEAGYYDLMKKANLSGRPEDVEKDRERWGLVVNNRNLVPVLGKRTNNLDVKSVTGDPKQARVSRISKIKTDLTNQQVINNTMGEVQGYSPINFASIDDADFAQEQVVDGYLSKITFKEELFGKGDNQKKYYYLDRADNTMKLMDINNRTIMVKNADMMSEIDNLMANRISHFKNLKSIDDAPMREVMVGKDKRSFKMAKDDIKFYVKDVDKNAEIVIDRTTGTVKGGGLEFQDDKMIGISEAGVLQAMHKLLK